ncbi:MAG TPA: TetR/AcrR family transcriptional regulator [Streptosporangiaceae bacterium]|jgi:AcrR family transcriptional regulator|nr:TetR/AcrR family transcriptional regulator [Streptosporangiaceae bacterium]
MTTASRPGAASAGLDRQRDPERTRREILDVAIGEFARNGYSGARVDEIAAKTRSTKRMIYYYFGGKERLYIAALEQAYATARQAERHLDVDHLDPVSAIRTLAELTFDHHESHPDFISLVATENIHRGEFIAKSAALAELNTPAMSVTASILERGYADGAFRRKAEAIDVHMMISAFCFFRMSNRYTFGAVFGVDMLDPSRRCHYRRMVGDMIVSYLTAPADAR